MATALCISAATVCLAGTVKKDQTMKSTITGSDISYTVYLPDGYSENHDSYPVLYLLHGFGDGHNTWLKAGRVKEIADSCIAVKAVEPLVIVMPNAGKTWYLDGCDGSLSYETMFFKEFIPHIESEYNISRDREKHAVAGNSMGGYGALLYSLKHPDYFSVCAPLSAGILTDKQAKNRHPEMFIQIFGPDILSPYYRENSILDILAALPRNYSEVAMFFDCGNQDMLSVGNCLAHNQLMYSGIRHRFIIRDGKHNWQFWRESLPEVLKFIDTEFR